MQPIRWGELKNGLLYYSHFDRVAHVSGIGIKHGSIHDPPGKCGRAHLTEHLMGSTEDPQVELTLWKYLGGPDEEWKVQTDRVSTFYGHDALLWKPHMLACFEIFANLVRRRVLNPEITESERAAVHQEYYLRGLDLIPELIDDLMHENMYERNPARNRIDCRPEDLLGITARDVQQCIRRHYVTNNMFVLLLSPSFEETKELVKKHFEDLPRGLEQKLDYDHRDDFPIFNSPKMVEVARAGINQEHVAIGFPLEPYTAKDKEAETIETLAFILEQRLYRRLRDANRDFNKGVYRVDATISRSFVHGIFYVSFATKSREFAKEATDTVLKEMERLKVEKVMPEELDAALSNREYRYREAFRDTPGQLADMIIEAVANGDHDLSHLHSYLDRLRKVSRRKLLEVANKYFTPNYIRVSVFPE